MSTLEDFEKKLTDNLIKALKTEYQNGSNIGESLENLILIVNETGTEEIACYGLYVNNAPIVSLSEEEIASRFKYNSTGMFSTNWFQHKIYGDEEADDLNNMLSETHSDHIDMDEEPELAITYLMYRISARLEQDKRLLVDEGIPVADNFMIFISDAGYFNFELRKKARELCRLPVGDYFSIISLPR